MNDSTEITDIVKRLRLGSPDGIEIEVPRDEDEYPDVFVSIHQPRFPAPKPTRVVKPIARRARSRHRTSPFSRHHDTAYDELIDMVDLEMADFTMNESLRISETLNAIPTSPPSSPNSLDEMVSSLIEPMTYEDIRLACQAIDEGEVFAACRNAGFMIDEAGHSFLAQERDQLRELTNFEKYCICAELGVSESDGISLIDAYGT